jgi:hypothetical protein
MTDSRTLPIAAAAVTAPAWLPTLAAVAPPLLIVATIGLALVAIFSDDKPKPTAATPDGDTPPVSNPPRKQERSFWDSFWNDGWFTENAKPAVAAPALPETARQQRIRTIEAEIASERGEIDRLNTDIKQTRTQLQNTYARPAPAAVTVQAMARPQANAVAPVRRQLASPRPTIPDAPISAPQSAVTHRSPATPAASQAPAVIHQATPTPGPFQRFAPKVNREDVAAIFANGKRLTRKDAVAALKARGVKQTTAYNALRDGGRFGDLLDVGEDGLLAFKG